MKQTSRKRTSNEGLHPKEREKHEEKENYMAYFSLYVTKDVVVINHYSKDIKEAVKLKKLWNSSETLVHIFFVPKVMEFWVKMRGVWG